MRQMEWHAFSLNAAARVGCGATARPRCTRCSRSATCSARRSFTSPPSPSSAGRSSGDAHQRQHVRRVLLPQRLRGQLAQELLRARPSQEGGDARFARAATRPTSAGRRCTRSTPSACPSSCCATSSAPSAHGTLYSLENQLLTVGCYTAGILWVLLVCGARLYSGVSSPADIQGGMLVGGVLVRIWLPVCESVSRALSSRRCRRRACRSGAFLFLLGAVLMLVHPYTPGDPRSWTALAFSTKAIAYAATFIVGSNTCASHPVCSASYAGWSASVALGLPGAARIAARIGVGYALLGFASVAATSASSFVEGQLRIALPSKPCAPMIARNFAMYAAAGAIVSMGAPTVLSVTGL